jgi:hypothetical protein
MFAFSIMSNAPLVLLKMSCSIKRRQQLSLQLICQTKKIWAMQHVEKTILFL